MERGRRVLLIEDDAAIRYVVTEALTDDNHVVRAASDGRQALAILADWRPDVILLDLMMPGMDGWSFRTQQRTLGRGVDVPLVLLSASRQADGAGSELGAHAIVAKPFALDDLLAAVRAATWKRCPSD